MAYTGRIILLATLISIFYTASLATTIRTKTMSENSNSELMQDKGTAAQKHFADFLRALYTPSKEDILAVSDFPENDVPNETFPLISVETEHDDRQQDYDQIHTDQNESQANSLLFPVLQKRNPRYCGSFLADALHLACSGSSYLPLFGKRSTSSVPVETTSIADQLTPITSQLNSWPFITSDKARSILSNQRLFHRYTRGVHDECCVKGCTFKELRSYCASSP